MKLKREAVDELMKERGMTIHDLAHQYRGDATEYWYMCNTKVGFRRAYQIAEILDCSVDDIVTYGNEKWPRWHRPEDDGRTKAGREKRRKQKERQKKNGK